MKTLTRTPVALARPVADLGALHYQLLEFGRPYYHCHDDGTWSATVKLPTDNPAVAAEAHSGFRHRSLEAAIEALLEKLG